MEFRVKALDREQAVLAQQLDAVDETDARRQIGLLGLRIISLTPVRQGPRFLSRSAKIPLVIFSQELVALLEAGLSLVESIEALTEKEANPAIRRPLEQILSRLYEGQTLGAALEEHASDLSLPVRGDGARQRAHGIAARGADAVHRLPAADRLLAQDPHQRLDLSGRAVGGGSSGHAVPHGVRGAALQLHLRRARLGPAVCVAAAAASGVRCSRPTPWP